MVMSPSIGGGESPDSGTRTGGSPLVGIRGVGLRAGARLSQRSLHGQRRGRHILIATNARILRGGRRSTTSSGRTRAAVVPASRPLSEEEVGGGIATCRPRR